MEYVSLNPELAFPDEPVLETIFHAQLNKLDEDDLIALQAERQKTWDRLEQIRERRTNLRIFCDVNGLNEINTDQEVAIKAGAFADELGGLVAPELFARLCSWREQDDTAIILRAIGNDYLKIKHGNPNELPSLGITLNALQADGDTEFLHAVGFAALRDSVVVHSIYSSLIEKTADILGRDALDGSPIMAHKGYRPQNYEMVERLKNPLPEPITHWEKGWEEKFVLTAELPLSTINEIINGSKDSDLDRNALQEEMTRILLTIDTRIHPRAEEKLRYMAATLFLPGENFERCANFCGKHEDTTLAQFIALLNTQTVS